MLELYPGAVVILDTVIDDVLIELALILDTVRVDRDSMLEVMVDPVREETEIEGAEMVEPVRVDKDSVPVVMEAVVMVEPWRVLTIMAGARTFRRALKLASPDAISTMILFFGMLNNTK